MTVEEELLFRRQKGYNWDRSSDRNYLPVGYAALVSFLIGWAGAILCMYQTYYTGPIAKLVGNGADVSIVLLRMKV